MDEIDKTASPRPPIRRNRTVGERLLRGTDSFFDSVGLRPLGIIVFAASVFALSQLLSMSVSSVRADAVATARIIDHPARVDSYATAVFVKPGDLVDVGTPLVELSPHFIDQDLQELAHETEQVINESRLAQAKLVVDEERWLAPGLRTMPKRPSLEKPTEEYFAKRIEVLNARREALLADRDALTVHSTFRGLVSQVAGLGTWVPAGSSVASVMPEYAEEIIAYVPANSNPGMIPDDSAVYIIGTEIAECRAPARIQRRGAVVEEAPGQLTRMFRGAVHGRPFHISIPENCTLGNGQTLALDFRMEAS